MRLLLEFHPIRKDQYPIVLLGIFAFLVSLVLLFLGLSFGSGVMTKLFSYSFGLSCASFLWLLSGKYIPKNSTQHILRIATVVDGGLAVQMNLAYILWSLDLPKGTGHVYHTIMADYFWAGPAMLVCAAFFYAAFKASFTTESYPM